MPNWLLRARLFGDQGDCGSCRGVRPLKVRPLGAVSGAAASVQLPLGSLSLGRRRLKVEDDVNHGCLFSVDNNSVLDLGS